MENINRFCALSYNQSYTVWDSGTFGQCFLWTVPSYISHSLLLVTGAYLFGLTTGLRSCNKFELKVYAYMLVTLLLALECLLEVILSYILKQSHPPAYVLAKALGFVSWSISLAVGQRLRVLPGYRRSFTQVTVLAFVFVGVSTSMQLHLVSKRLLKMSLISWQTLPLSMYGSLIYGLLNICYGFSCLLIIIGKEQGIRHRRKVPSVAGIHVQSSVQVLDSRKSSPACDESASPEQKRLFSKLQHENKTNNFGKAEVNVGFLSWLTFWWANGIVKKGYCMELRKPEDLYELPPSLDTDDIKAHFQGVIRFEQRKSLTLEMRSELISDCQIKGPRCTRHAKFSLMQCLLRAFGKRFLLYGFLKLVVDSVSFAGPILLHMVVSFMENKLEPTMHGFYYALALFGANLFLAIARQHYLYGIVKVHLQVRAALITAVYEKALAVSSSSLSKYNSGQVLNFMSTDADRVSNFVFSFHEFWSMPLQIGIALILLWREVGVSSLAGLAVIVILIPINKFISSKIMKVSKENMEHKDGRVKIISEILHGIRVLKFYAWETIFKKKVDVFRQAELRCLKISKYLNATSVYLWVTTPIFISVLTFLTFSLLGNHLTAAKVFTSVALFNMLVGPLNVLPWVVNVILESRVSLKRIEKFMSLGEVNLDDYYATTVDDGGNIHCKFQSASFTWKGSDDVGRDETKRKSKKNDVRPCGETQDTDKCEAFVPFTLKNIQLPVLKGQLVGLTGRVGSGKTSLFAALTAEMEKKAGNIYLSDDVHGFAYVAQEPWIQHMNVRDNILFGRAFDKRRYEQVIFACALEEDLNQFPAGDMTEIGERGVNLSGGQKARVALARAVYQDRSFYLLDDPLSAVDAHVAAHIFKHCIMGLLSAKTRILATHHLKYLRDTDCVVVVDEGSVVANGSPEEVLQRYSHLISVTGEAVKNDCKQNITSDRREGLNDAQMANEGALVKDEERTTGAVSFSVYASYWKSVGQCLAACTLGLIVLMQASRNVCDWWLAHWVSRARSSAHVNGTLKNSNFSDESGQSGGMGFRHIDDSFLRFLLVYVALALANSVFSLFGAFTFAYGCLVACRALHAKLLNAILNAPISFFDITPVGRIINRLSSDTYAIDEDLPLALNVALAQMVSLLGTIVVTCYGVPWLAVVIVPLGIVYYFAQKYYRITSRELKRMESMTRSPIYEHFSETLSGLPTIRAFRESKRFARENQSKLELNQRVKYSVWIAWFWLATRIQLLAVLTVSAVSALAIVQHRSSTVNPGMVGLAISYALNVTQTLSYVVETIVEAEKQFVSVERVVAMIKESPQEEQTGGAQITFDWPEQGVISFKAVKLIYRAGLTAALQDVSFVVHSGEKIGICGRTGSGKSSLLRLLFRAVSLTSGEIAIDGVNIADVPVRRLRNRLSIIPQDPFLFDDTVKNNLDPAGEFRPSDIWDVIRKCHLEKVIQDLGGLDTSVGERGQMLSAGQRQLFCLARAMLKRSKVICLDEATASVDLDTDRLIQRTIRCEFTSSTLLLVAHRLDTIMDSDRVMVMSSGRLVEFAPPADLLNNPESLFFALVKEH